MVHSSDVLLGELLGSVNDGRSRDLGDTIVVRLTNSSDDLA